jgi:tetrahydromethanopterin S-methyltransferase subunit B
MKVPMDSSNEALHLEVRRLRTEIQQLREIVNALFNAVFEDNEEEVDSLPGRDDNSMYN